MVNPFLPTALAAFSESITEKVIQFGDLVDLLGRLINVIRDTMKLNEITIQRDIRRSRVIIARLTDGTDIDHDFLIRQPVVEINFLG